MARTTIVAGNWKMNLDRAKARELAAAVAARRGEAAKVELVLCPPALYVETVGTALAGANLNRFDSATIYARMLAGPFRFPAAAFRGSADAVQAVEAAMQRTHDGEADAKR